MDWTGLAGFTAYVVILVLAMVAGLEIIKRFSK